MSYKTRPTGDFLKTGKVGKLAAGGSGVIILLTLHIFHVKNIHDFTRNDSLSYQPDIKLKLLQKLTRFLIFFVLLLISPLTNVPMMEFIWAFYFNS